VESIRDRTVTWAEWTLDGCCGEGGGARGLVRAGHHVTGVDINPALRDGYLRSGAHEFICADILDVLADTSFMTRFTYASLHPPCQSRSGMTRCRPGPVTLCMWMWQRETYRHRLIEAGSGLVLTPPEPPAWAWEPPTPAHARARVIRRHKDCGWPHPVPTEKAGHWKPGCGKFVSVAGHERKEPVRRVMEIDWASDREAVAEAVPWYMMAWVAGQLAAWRARQKAAA
jgi:hypothetical protein